MKAEFGVKNARKFFQALEKQGQEAQRAARTALKVEGYRLMGALKDEIRSGAPGGRRFAALSVMGAYRARPYNRTPLRRLAVAVRYDVQGSGARTRFVFGFLGKRSSKSWLRIARQAQEGYTTPVTDKQRRYLVRLAGRLPKSAIDAGEAKYFYLRRTTTRMTTPARPIIDPFWRAHEHEARRNIAENFRHKMRGERI